MTKAKAKTPILHAVQKTAADLARLGLIKKSALRKYDALCIGLAEPMVAEKKQTQR